MKGIRRPRIWDNKNKKFIPYYSIMFYANNGPINLCIPDDKGGAANIVNAKKFDVEFPTGLYDRNNKKIFDGDILASRLKRNHGDVIGYVKSGGYGYCVICGYDKDNLINIRRPLHAFTYIRLVRDQSPL